MLNPYTGNWTFEEAAHLLRRTIFGPTKTRILQAVEEGLDGTIATLMSAPPIVDPPIYIDFEDDPEATIGETWVGKEIDWDIMDINFHREKTMWAWWFMRMNKNDQTITEKLTLFWHNHFVIAGAGHANANWDYLNLLRDFALGDFKELTKRITIDKSMLVYLNGTSNFKDEPNENYARELLELFTIGKGDLVAPGDYTHYTEQDIVEIAKALTGWIAWVDVNETAAFEPWGSIHDTSTKQLSHRFDHQTIPNLGEEEYKYVIDIIFSKDEVAYHICRRLYMWFVNYEISDAIETDVIAPMAQILLDNDYVIQPALEALLKSEHFYDFAIRGCMIKNPLDYHFSSFNTLLTKTPPDLIAEYKMWLGMYWEFNDLQMAMFRIPAVAGWPAYHQSPNFYRNWINSASLALRKRLYYATNWHVSTNSNDELKGYDFVDFIATLDNPLDVNSLIDEICQLIFPRPMLQEQKDFFKQALLNQLPDFEWGDEYGSYLSTPDDLVKRQAVENKLRSMFLRMMGVPEFHLS